MKLPPEWTEFIGLLCAARARFLVVGAHALAVHGRPRATGDLDILIDPTPVNAVRVATALRAFGFPALARRTRDLAVPERMATLGRRGRITVAFGSRRVGILGRAEFERNKRAAGRPKDLLDLALLAEVRPRRARPKRATRAGARGRARR